MADLAHYYPLALLIGGIHSIAFGVFHLFFWKIFNWRTDLAKLTVANRAIIQIFNVLSMVVFSFMAVVALGYPQELLTAPLGKIVLAFCCIFWVVRLVVQFVWLPYNNLYIHLLNVLFLLGAVAFGLPLLG